MPVHPWVADRSRDFTALCGRYVKWWVGVEMALRDDGADGAPQFDDPKVPCLQLLGLLAHLDEGGFLSVGIYQDDDTWGLWPRPSLEAKYREEGLWNGAYRCRPLNELPTGRVERVTTFLDEGQLAEASLQIAAQPLLLIAGELVETSEGDLLFCRLDESVLAFIDPTAASQAPWTTTRHNLIRLDEATIRGKR